MKAIVTIGISASGKTTFAEQLCHEDASWVNVNRDDARYAISLDFKNFGWQKYKFSKENENKVTEMCDSLIEHAAENGVNVIISDTNLNPKFRNKLLAKLGNLGYEVEIKEFPITLEEAWKRDQFRGKLSVGRDVIYKQWQQWLDYKGERYRPDPRNPKAIICDIDGTAAHMVDRGPFEWHRVGEDKPDEIVRMMVNAFKAQGYTIIFVSGRDSVCYQQTHDWLQRHGFAYDALLMRKEGDMRKDAIVKREIFYRDIAPFFNVEAVIDDRKQVLLEWFDIGIPKVISVGNPYIDF